MLLKMMTVVPACSSCNVCFFYFLFILSVFFLGRIWVFVLACHCKNVLAVKSNYSPFPSKAILLTPWPRVANFIMFAIMILFNAANF